MAELHELTATEAAERIRSKTLSPVELVQALLARIEQ
jgi:Asp-tRNA(Asn)/Glu-tRNA(Gln) amidotransferase A subunit family amidase